VLGEFGGGGCVGSLSLPAALRGLPILSEDKIKKIINMCLDWFIHCHLHILILSRLRLMGQFWRKKVDPSSLRSRRWFLGRRWFLQ
jgi:hypothetical protein